jgi:transposase
LVTVTDEKGRVVAEKRPPNDLEKMLALLLPWREERIGVVVESTYNGYWLVDGLQAAVFEVRLAPTPSPSRNTKSSRGKWENGDRPEWHLLKRRG